MTFVHWGERRRKDSVQVAGTATKQRTADNAKPNSWRIQADDSVHM